MNEILSTILEIMGGLTILGGGIAAIKTFYNFLTSNHDKGQKYEDYDSRIKDLDSRINELEINFNNKITLAHMNAEKSLEEIQAKTDARFDEMQNNMDKRLNEMQNMMDAKFQQISSELCMLSYCTYATLDGLKQLNCNGKVSEAREKLEKHLNQQAHGEV